MNRNHNVEYNFLEAIDIITNSGLNLDDFTQKDFDKIFKGTQKLKGLLTLRWLRSHGIDDHGRICWTYCGNAITPFAEIISKDTFVIDNLKRKKLVDKRNGRDVTEITLREYKSLDMVTRKEYDYCEIVAYEESREVARYHYKLNLDREAILRNIEYVERCLNGEILHLQKKLDRRCRTMNAINKIRERT